MHANNSTIEDKFLYAGFDNKDMDESSQDRFEEVQTIQGFGPRQIEMAKQNSSS